ncbi:hypothetical protein, partial [Mesorhizobium sp. M7A.F.Ca.CA.001.16.1.1]|uniref:hypothetical protein n=1 Tax=Mesorhizobium sp. M7A.F.Ca.CA.001.16.1.1 TaxID=2496683 RepID=UPI0019D48C1C
GSPILPVGQAKPAVKVKFELKSKCLACHCPALAGGFHNRLPLDFWLPNIDIGHKIHIIRD